MSKNYQVADINRLRRQYLEFFQAKQHLIYPSASLKSDDPTLMFTSAGMVQFKPYFLGATPKFAGYEGLWPRVTTAQKCLRINDIENVGRTLRHHSFFEMMGNFSFGDYFKKEAARWAWEFLTEHLGLDPERLYVTVYLDDDEAYAVWRDEVGVPEARISRWGEDENFWPANAVSDGPNGPCGPCSEIFYDRGEAYGSADETGPNTGSGDRFIEIWNLVFTQSDRRDGGVLEPLPQQNIDTGLGFERLVAVMAGVEDAYGSALFQPTIRRVSELSGQSYQGTASVSHRVIADHSRAITFAISDGILPANDGPGYVVKMLLRRASRHAWLLGMREPVLYHFVDSVIEAMGEVYPELQSNREQVQGIIKTEESQFLRTLEAGIVRVNSVLEELQGDTLPGEVAFDLWQTYGFPLDLSEEIATERGIRIDRQGYARARDAAKERSRSERESTALFSASKDSLGHIAQQHGESQFVGYQQQRSDSRVVALLQTDDSVDEGKEGDELQIILDITPFYAESGGQIGDEGMLEWPEGKAIVLRTKKSSQGLFLHQARILRGSLRPGQQVRASVSPSRIETEKHHSATHLLHAALRHTLGRHVAQAGSLVEPERLRFDFSHPQALSSDDISRIETLVNRWIQADLRVSTQTVSLAQARQAGAMMLFGEKYGEQVRMVSMQPASANASTNTSADTSADTSASTPTEAVSVELCGGTHVSRSGSIGSLLIVSEEAVSAGVRRIEALVGMAALQHMQSLRANSSALASALGAKPAELQARVTKLQNDLKAAQRDAAQLRDKLAQAQTQGQAQSHVQSIAGFNVQVLQLEGLDASALRNAADSALQQSKADIVLLSSDGLMVSKVTPDAQKRGAHAGQLIRELARRAGGGGGGRPDMAQAGLKDASKLPEALAALPEILKAFISA